MKCESVNELLPWFVNGTLEPEEQAKVEKHLADCVACRAALEQTVTLGTASSQHLPIDLLLDLADGTHLPAADAEATKLHLAVCPACAGELARARGELPEAAVLPLPERADPAPRQWPSRWLAATAAALVLTSGAWFTTWLRWSQARDRLDSMAQGPVVNPAFLELVPETVVRGDASTPAVDLTPGAAFAVLLLVSETMPPTDARLRLEIVGPGEGEPWVQEGLTRTDAGTYTLILPTAFLSPGEYGVHVLVAGSETAEPLESFRFRVVGSSETH